MTCMHTSTHKNTVAVVVPTYNGYSHTMQLLQGLEQQQAAFDVLVIDSQSTDGTNELIKSHPVVTHYVEISPQQFNHGASRQLMVEQFAAYEIYVFMTQNAYPENSKTISEVIAPFTDEMVGAVCGRQLPHLDANPIAAHARLFNYGPQSALKSKADIPRLGIKVPFISNSFSAYRNTALQEVGGFPVDVILSEDMFVAANMVQAGWKIAYAAEACVRHSHNYSLGEGWRRYFDIGVFHSQQPWIQEAFGGAGGEGLRMCAQN